LTYQGRKEQDSSNKGSVNGIREHYTDASQQNEKAYIEVFFSFFYTKLTEINSANKKSWTERFMRSH